MGNWRPCQLRKYLILLLLFSVFIPEILRTEMRKIIEEFLYDLCCDWGLTIVQHHHHHTCSEFREWSHIFYPRIRPNRFTESTLIKNIGDVSHIYIDIHQKRKHTTTEIHISLLLHQPSVSMLLESISSCLLWKCKFVSVLVGYIWCCNENITG